MMKEPDKIPAPGEVDGPCKGECVHEDCTITRSVALNLCYLCGKALGYATGYYHFKSGMVHEVCFEKSKKWYRPWGKK